MNNSKDQVVPPRGRYLDALLLAVWVPGVLLILIAMGKLVEVFTAWRLDDVSARVSVGLIAFLAIPASLFFLVLGGLVALDTYLRRRRANNDDATQQQSASKLK
jgi:hypothetical protein